MNYDIREYGAVADGETVNTQSIQAAVDACAEAGGGRVVVPAGTFVSGSIHLRSNIEFHLAPGALLLGSSRIEDFGLLDLEGHGYRSREWLHAALLNTCDCENVAITGTGTIDGCGSVWWASKNSLDESVAAVRKETPQKGWRPPILFFWNSCRVKVRDVKLQNSPMYAILPVCCLDMVIDGVSIHNPWKPYNNCDGIDINSCKDVRITNCRVDTGDDGICLKTLPGWYLFYGPNDEGVWTQDLDKPQIACDNILIENCVVRRAHSGVAVWAEVSGGMSNVVVNNCVFDGTRTGIQISRWQYPGGHARNCSFTNIVMNRVGTGIVVGSTEDPCDTDEPGRGAPEFHNIRIAHITGTKLLTACKMAGTATGSVHDIELSDIRMESDLGFHIEKVDNLRLKGIDLKCQNTPLVLKDCANVELAAFNPHPSSEIIPAIRVERVTDSWIHGCTASPGTGVFLGTVGSGNEVLLESNRLKHAREERATVEAENRWNTCSHAYTGSRWIRDSGKRNDWLPMPDVVAAFVRERWTPEQVDGIWSVSRVDPDARDGAELPENHGEGTTALHNVDRIDLRNLYIIQSRSVDERLVVFEDGELLRAIDDPTFHAHFEERRDDFELARIDREAKERGEA